MFVNKDFSSQLRPSYSLFMFNMVGIWTQHGLTYLYGMQSELNPSVDGTALFDTTSNPDFEFLQMTPAGLGAALQLSITTY